MKNTMTQNKNKTTTARMTQLVNWRLSRAFVDDIHKVEKDLEKEDNCEGPENDFVKNGALMVSPR